MDALLRLFRKLWLLIRREQFDRELAEEMAFHREEAEKSLEAERHESRQGSVRGSETIRKCNTTERAQPSGR